MIVLFLYSNFILRSRRCRCLEVAERDRGIKQDETHLPWKQPV